MRALMMALTLGLAACGADEQKQGEAPAPAEQAAAPTSAEDALAQMPRWETARAAGVDFRAVGQEPGWMLDIYTRGVIKFVWDYGENYAEFAVSDPTAPQDGVTRYEAHSDGRALVITTRRTPCEDAMSGQPYPATVEVVIDGRTLNGCGKSV